MSNDLTPKSQSTALTIVTDEELTKDYEFAKANMQNIVMKGNEVLDELVNVAMQSQQARAYEVLTNLLKVMSDTNKSILEASLLNQQIIEKKRQNQQPDDKKGAVTNNNLFVTPSELADMLRPKKLE